MDLRLLAQTHAVCRLEAGAAIVPSPGATGLWAYVWTADETSVVCPSQAAPEGSTVEDGWRVLKVAGPLEFSTVGVLADLSRCLAEAGISLFAVSTFDTDYLLIKDDDIARAIVALDTNGHRVVED